MKVVVYGEGGLDSRGAVPLDTPPADKLPANQQGVVHVIVQRVLGEKGADTIEFVSPLRPGGALPRGSRLLHEPTLRRALAWNPEQCPEVAVIFVDADGNADRRQHLNAILEKRRSAGVMHPVAVVALCVQELEAWLLADIKSASTALGASISQPKKLENMKPGMAKELLRSRIGSAQLEEHVVRRRIAETMEVDAVRKACPSFDRFASDLARAVAPAPGETST